MQQSTDVSPTEWRWAIIFSALLVALTLVPLAWAYASDAPADGWQFMGILANPIDGATYLAKISEGARGQWLFTMVYTPEQSIGAFINTFYLFLGHVSRLLRFSSPLTYHVARMVTGFVMFLSLYHLGATIWQRLRARRMFFGLAAVGSGLGWLSTTIAPGMLLPSDLMIPESIPLYAAYTNPHFPLMIALLALLAAMLVRVSRPGYSEMPTLQNGGLATGVIAGALGLMQPQAWVPIAAGMCVFLLITTLRLRKLPPTYQLAWAALLILPALPFLAYDLLIVNMDPVYKSWNAQNVTPSGSPFNYLFGFGLLLILAVPGLVRALRRFERDGDQFMLVWLVVNALLLYAPLNLQRRLVIGMIIPLVYFCVRSIEDYWLPRLRPGTRRAFLILLFVLILPSNVLALLLPLVGIMRPQAGLENGQLLSSDYASAIVWLHDNTTTSSVVLALPIPSLWIPAYTPARVVYAHPFETVEAPVKLKEVRDWYSGASCSDVLTKYKVQYVVVGPDPAPAVSALLPSGSPETTPCATALGTPVQRFNSVAVYAVRP
jgi:hypothetical protein